MTVLKLTSVGNSTGIILPQEILERLRVERGDTVFAVETPHGLLITAHDPEVERQVSLAHDIMVKYRDTLNVLAQ